MQSIFRTITLAFSLFALPFSLSAQMQTVEEVYQILQQKCVSCHSGTAPAANLDFVGTGATPLSKAVSVANKMVNKDPLNAAAKAKGHKLVMPGRPDQSYLFRKINGDFDNWYDALGTNEGNQMPTQGTALTKVEKEMIRQWILHGADNTGILVDKALITQFYEVYGVKAFPDGPPPKPAASEGFQIRTGPFFLPPDGEVEYYIKHKLNLPNAVEVNRLDMQFPLYSHHLIIYNFETASAAASIPDGLRLNAFHNGINLVAAVQGKTDLRLPATTAFKWNKDFILDMNTHYINYSLNHPYQAESFTNVYTQTPGTAAIEMKAELIPNLNFIIPNNGNPFTATRSVYAPGADTLFLWGLMGHTHKYGSGYKVFERLPNGAKGIQLYDASCAQGLPGCPSPYFDYQHIPMRYFEPLHPVNWSNGIIHEATWVNDGPVPLGFGPTSDDEMMVLIAFYTEQQLTTSASEPQMATRKLQLSPNPVSQDLRLSTSGSSGLGLVQIMDMMGRIVYEAQNVTSQSLAVPVSHLASGLYQVRSETAGVAKLVVQH